MVFSLECWGLLKLSKDSKVTCSITLYYFELGASKSSSSYPCHFFQILRINSRGPKETHGIFFGMLGSPEII